MPFRALDGLPWEGWLLAIKESKETSIFSLIVEVCDAAQSKLAHYVGNIDNAIGQAVDLLKRAAMASMHIRKASNIPIVKVLTMLRDT